MTISTIQINQCNGLKRLSKLTIKFSVLPACFSRYCAQKSTSTNKEKFQKIQAICKKTEDELIVLSSYKNILKSCLPNIDSDTFETSYKNEINNQYLHNFQDILNILKPISQEAEYFCATLNILKPRSQEAECFYAILDYLKKLEYIKLNEAIPNLYCPETYGSDIEKLHKAITFIKNNKQKT